MTYLRRVRPAMIVLATACILASAGAEAASPSITFAREIAPILFERCATCHRPGGLAPFSVLTYASARRHATQIADVTKRRVMPPWKAEPGYDDFVGMKPLSEAEIGLIQRWVNGGAPEGDPHELPSAPAVAAGWQLGQPDLVVTSPPLYTLPADGADRFHGWVLPIPTSVARYVRGIEFRPDNPRVVHHANILLDRTSTSRQRNDNDPTLSERGLLAATASMPPGYFLGWAPGQLDPLLPKGLSWRLEPRTDLVVQLHLKPTGKPEPVTFSVAFYFTNEPPLHTPVTLRLGRQNIDIPAGRSEYAITDSYTLPVDAEVLAIKPHAHYRARQIEAFARRPDGTTVWLLYIKDWDFNWQHVYRYTIPISLLKGSTITMRYTYDNAATNPRNPVQPPQLVHWGPLSFDEMGDLWIQLLTRRDEDSSVLNGAFRRKWASEDIVGDEVQLKNDPANCSLLEDVGSLYLELGNVKEALSRFATCLAAKPAVASAHFNVGVALAAAGRSSEAIHEYEEALRLDPDLAAAHNSLGNALEAVARVDDALKEYLEVVRLQPTHAGAQNNIAVILMGRGQLEEATSHLREALRLDPALPDAHYNLGLIAQKKGEPLKAAREFRDAITLQPGWSTPLLDLAWLLATTPDDEMREGKQAVALAERALLLLRGPQGHALDVLAASYAADGQFDRAIAMVEAAIRVGDADSTARELNARRELYAKHRAYRQQVSTVTTGVSRPTAGR